MPDELADQIAAGEVVERPASAVKELVENALDAGASRVRVDLEEGGLGLIRVTDDGFGMSRADAELAIVRHATSKIRSREDLFAIGTLGFRGEALPSIASVSRFTLLTKASDTIGGTRVMVEGGKLVDVVDAGAPPGTEVTVRDLFYNTPARLKFLKSRATELKHVVESVQRMALANPEVGFTVTHNGRTSLDLPGVTKPADRVFSILGAKEARDVFPLQPAHQDGVSCTGFFGKPALTRRTSSGIWTFVNGRFVRDKTVIGAIRTAYQGMLDKGRHPIVILQLDVPVDAVDVNVHPAKTEVRFHDSSAVFRAVRRSIANSLSEAPWVPEGEEPGTWTGVRSTGDVPSGNDELSAAHQGSLPVRSYVLHGPEWGSGSRGDVGGASTYARPVASADDVPDEGARLAPPATSGGGDPTAGWTQGTGAERVPPVGSGYFESLHYIGNVRGAYLLATDGEGLVVVDQHAAHERITFEVLKRSWKERRYHAQPLLVPRVLTLDAVRSATLADNLELFGALGFEIEPFGGNDFALKSAPAVLRSAQHEALIVDALDEIGESGHSGRIDEAIDAVLIRMACHGSVRAGDRLGIEEVYRLYRELDEVDFGANCPHGRPVYFRMSLEEIETRFDRR